MSIMKEKPKSSCCEKCFDSFGGGTTMLPLIRRCMNLDCSCHTTSKSEEKQVDVQDKVQVEEWEAKLGQLTTRAWQKGLWHSESELSKSLKSFISTLLQEEREKAYKQGWKDGCNELLEGRFDTRF